MSSTPRKVSSLRAVEWPASKGSRRDLLVALRDRLWQALHDERTQPRDLSPLSLRLKELQAEIADLDARDEDERSDPPDEPFRPEDL